MKIKFIKSTIYMLIVVSMFSKGWAIGVGEVVYDPTQELNMVKQLEETVKSIDLQTKTFESLGKGDFTPSVIDYFQDVYKRCGGQKQGLPEWFPSFKFPQICSDESKLLEKSVSFYKDNLLPLPSDKQTDLEKKKKFFQENNQKIRAHALALSSLRVEQSKSTSEKIENLHKALTGSKSSIEVQKVQLATQIAILEELQKMNESQALILHVIAWKN
jgi:hypothetical protein